MHLRYALPALLTLPCFACVIDPGILEGGLEDEAESGESGDSETTETGDTAETDSGTSDESDTGEPGLAECLQGTNPQGGSDPGDFSVGTCPAFVCDEGWGHETGQLPIAWTLEFAKPAAETLFDPVGVVVRSEGEGVVIVARRDTGSELLTVSAQAELLDSTMLATSMWISGFEAGEGMIFLAAFDEQDSSSWVLAISEIGELLWSTPMTGSIQTLAALPEGGVLAALIVDGGEGRLQALDAAGGPSWATPTLTPIGLGVSPSRGILVTGHQPLEFTEHFLNVHASGGELLGQFPAPGQLTELLELHFIDEARVLASGYSSPPNGNGVVQLFDLDALENVWVHQYNRALNNCQLGIDIPNDLPTWETFGQMARLPDGTFLLAVVEEGERSDADATPQPRVLHIDENGEFLAGDRGLWMGQGKAIAAGDDGSAYALLTIGGYMNYDGPNDGFYLRKYQP